MHWPSRSRRAALPYEGVREKAMNELQFAARIRHLLNQATQLDPALAQRLRAARENALARQRAERASVLVWADNVFGNGWGWGSLSAGVVLPGVVLAGGGLGIYRRPGTP